MIKNKMIVFAFLTVVSIHGSDSKDKSWILTTSNNKQFEIFGFNGSQFVYKSCESDAIKCIDISKASLYSFSNDKKEMLPTKQSMYPNHYDNSCSFHYTPVRVKWLQFVAKISLGNGGLEIKKIQNLSDPRGNVYQWFDGMGNLSNKIPVQSLEFYKSKNNEAYDALEQWKDVIDIAILAKHVGLSESFTIQKIEASEDKIVIESENDFYIISLILSVNDTIESLKKENNSSTKEAAKLFVQKYYKKEFKEEITNFWNNFYKLNWNIWAPDSLTVYSNENEFNDEPIKDNK